MGPGTVGAIVAVDSLVGIRVGSILGILQADNNNTRLNMVIRKMNDPSLFTNYLSKIRFRKKNFQCHKITMSITLTNYYAAYSEIGIVKVIVVPLPRILESCISPPCNSMSCFEIYNPSPVPESSRLLALSTW